MTSSQDIIREIESTRADIRSTLGVLENRLSVDSLLRDVAGPAKNGTVAFGRALGGAARANPLAFAVTAVGLGWLMFGAREAAALSSPTHKTAATGDERLDPHRSNTDDAGRGRIDELVDRARATAVSATGEVGATAKQAGAQARESAERAMAWTKEKAADVSHATRHSLEIAARATKDTARLGAARAQQAAASAGRLVQEHPIAVGAAVIVGGAALALILTRRSNGIESPDTAPATAEAADWASLAGMSMGSDAGASGGTDKGAPVTSVDVEEQTAVYSAANRSAAADAATRSTAAPGEIPPAVTLTDAAERPEPAIGSAVPAASAAGREPRPVAGASQQA